MRPVAPLALVVALALVGCSGSAPGTPVATVRPGTPSPSSPPATDPVQTPESATGVARLPEFAPMDPGEYYVEPLFMYPARYRVYYTVSGEGWISWFGAFKEARGRDQSVAVSILATRNLVTHGCLDHAEQDPPVGPGVEDLAVALSELAPFEVVQPPTDVTVDGYTGRHLVLALPDLETEKIEGDHWFTACEAGQVRSWIGSPLSYAFYGYSPGLIEEYWIVDVDGNRLMISAIHHPDSPEKDVAEMRTLLDSIRIVDQN